MTSRFAPSFRCLNGPKQDYWIDAPPGTEAGRSCALPWIDAHGKTQYAVYVLTEIPQPEGAPYTEEKQFGLMFVQSHRKPEQAQDHVERLALVIMAARQTN